MQTKKIIDRLRYPGNKLSERVIHGTFWVFSLRVFNRGFSLVRIIILARLLAPEDFGLFGIAMLALHALQTFSVTGLDQALIQKKGDIKTYLNSAWTVQVIRGFVLAVILVAGAPLVAIFFKEPQALMLIRVLGIAVFIKSLRNIGIIYFQKDLEFHKQFAFQLSGTFTDLAVSITAAFILRNAWALIFGLLAGNSVRLVVSYLVHSYRPSFTMDREKSKELFNFGRWILGSSIVIFIATQGDDIFVGKVLSTYALGLYQISYRLSNAMATEITHVISKVTFPAYSKLQDSVLSLKKAFMKTFNVTVFFSIPLAVGIYLLIPEFATIFLGEKWLPLIRPVRILAIAGAIRSISAIWGPLYRARGIPNLAFIKNVWRVIATFAPIYILTTKFGISGTSVSVVIGILAAFAFDIYYIEVKSRLDLKLTEILKNLLPPITGSIFFLVFILSLKFTTTMNWVLFIAVIPVSIGLYIAGVYLFQLMFKFSPLKDLASLLKSAKR